MKKALLLIPVILFFAGCIKGDDMADYPITNVAELQALGNLANLNEDGRLLNDIDATGFAFTPIGDNANKFTGSFDGQGFVITGLTVNTPFADYVGLFGFVQCANEFRDVELRNCDVTGKNYVGALIGLNNGAAVTNCSASGNISSPSRADHIIWVAGLIGASISLDITNCSFEGNITVGNATGAGKDIHDIAGLIGANNGGDIINCHAIVVVTTGSAADLIYQIGGLVGQNGLADVSDSYAQGSIILGDAGNQHGDIGGFIGENNNLCDLTDCYDTMDISIGDSLGWAGLSNVGGFIGECRTCNLTRCRTSGSFVMGDCTAAGLGNVGGFIGYNEATISQCSARRDVVIGNLAGNAIHIGAFTGHNWVGDSSDSYSRGNVMIGNVTGNLDDIGGFCGALRNGNYVRVYSVGSVSYGVVGGVVGDVGGLVGDITVAGTVDNANCFWDTENSGLAVSDGGTGHTTAEMNTESTFTDAGWDFDAVWSICDPPQPSYPWLQWENIQCLGVIISLIG